MNSESKEAAVVMDHFRTITEDHEELQTVIFDIIKTIKLRYGSVLTSVKQQTP